MTAAIRGRQPGQAGVTDADILNDAKTTGDVVSFGLGTQGQRFSPSTQINAKTVKNLVPAWSMSFGGEKQRGQESQPVIHNGKMFVTASYSRLFAVDAKSGKKLWKYEHRLPDGIMPCCDVINRGAALYGDLVIFATLDAQLVALNQDTGKVVWKEKLGDYAAGYSATAAPIIAKGKLITGVSGGEFGVVGRIDARDPLTGKLIWTRPTVEGHMGYAWNGWRQGRKRHFRHHQRHLDRRPLANRRRSDLERRHLRSGNQPDLRRHRQPGPVEQPPASGRQPVLVLDRGHRRRYRQDRLALPEHPARRLGL